MLYELYPFNQKSAAVFKVNVGLHAHFYEKNATFEIVYNLQGNLDSLVLPKKSEGKGIRAHNLWKETCFEAFFKIKGLNSYLEFNFSPSLNWNCYFFDTYRAGMRDFLQIDNMALSIQSAKDLKLNCHFNLNYFEDRDFKNLNKNNFRAGLSAVLFQKDIGASYFALTHPASAPDFHHEKSFSLKL